MLLPARATCCMLKQKWGVPALISLTSTLVVRLTPSVHAVVVPACVGAQSLSA